MRRTAAKLLAALMPFSAAATPLEPLRWEARPILVFAEEGDPRLAEQLSRFELDRADLDERENVVIVDTEPGSALRQRFRPAAFTVILVGKDGGEKFRRNDLVNPDELHALIDTMPMRRREMMAEPRLNR
ncbi:MAG: DUF4174 domain-containing protein [Pseudomonadota bacterium]